MGLQSISSGRVPIPAIGSAAAPPILLAAPVTMMRLPSSNRGRRSEARMGVHTESETGVQIGIDVIVSELFGHRGQVAHPIDPPGASSPTAW